MTEPRLEMKINAWIDLFQLPQAFDLSSETASLQISNFVYDSKKGRSLLYSLLFSVQDEDHPFEILIPGVRFLFKEDSTPHFVHPSSYLEISKSVEALIKKHGLWEAYRFAINRYAEIKTGFPKDQSSLKNVRVLAAYEDVEIDESSSLPGLSALEEEDLTDTISCTSFLDQEGQESFNEELSQIQEMANRIQFDTEDHLTLKKN